MIGSIRDDSFIDPEYVSVPTFQVSLLAVSVASHGFILGTEVPI